MSAFVSRLKPARHQTVLRFRAGELRTAVRQSRPVRVTSVVTAIPGPKGDPGEKGESGAVTSNDQVARAAIADHIDSPTPHPAYDNMIDLVLLIENALV